MDLYFRLFGNKEISVFCIGEWLRAEELPSPPKLGTLLIKTFFLPHQLLCYAYVQWQVAESILPGNKTSNYRHNESKVSIVNITSGSN